MTGDVTIHPRAQVLIMTTEILRNAILENPALLDDVEFVIFDEVHYLDDRERGTVWEESVIFLPPAIRILALSATVANVDEFGAWMREVRHHDIAVVREVRRPVPLSYWCWTPEAGAFDAGKLALVRKRLTAQLPPRSRRPRRRGRGGPEHGPGARYGPRDLVDPSRLFDELEARALLPALVFSFSRKDCERLARRNEGRDLLTGEEAEAMRRLQAELVDLFQLDPLVAKGEIFSMARRGVGYHHAGMLPIFKEVVERMFTAGLLKLLFTTETFALGINMPARTVVFNALRKFDGVTFDWLRTREFLQMAGRAGRQGIDEKGHVYCVLGRLELEEAPLERLFAGRPEPVDSRFRMAYSTLLHLVPRVGRERLGEAWEKSFHSFQARAKNAKARERQRRELRQQVERHLALLDQLGYLEGDRVTPRGALARLVPGYELQVAELLFAGTLENLPPQALALVFVGLIHEERRRGDAPWVPARHYGNLRRAVSEVIGRIVSAELALSISPGSKRPEWGLSVATLAWCDGASIDDLEELSDSTVGDVCRVFRMAIQLLRNVRRVIDPDWDLRARLEEAIELMNRDEMDARRQLELG